MFYHDELINSFYTSWETTHMNIGLNELVYPKAVWMTVTHNCNYDCKWCYEKNYSNNTRDMDIVRAKDVIDVLAKYNTKKVIFIGGEPTLYKSLNSLIKHAKSNGMNCALVTNGVLLADKHYSSTIIDSGISSCNISLKGTTEDEYVKNVGKSGLNQTIEGYRNMIASGCHTVLSFVIGTPAEKYYII